MRRVQRYVVENALTPAIPRATALFTLVDTVVSGMEDRGGLQVEGNGTFRGGAAEDRMLAKEMRAVLQAISLTARGLDPETFPGVAVQFRINPASRSYQRLRDTAEGFLAALTPIKTVFTDRGFAVDFDTALEAQLVAFTAATGRKFGGRQSRKHGTAGIVELTKQAIEIMKELDPLMRNYLKRTDVELLAVWRAAARAYSPPRTTAPGTPPDDGSGSGSGGMGSGGGSGSGTP